MRGLKGKLVDNSLDAYVLALETINRLSVKYRIQSFVTLQCNAWELLLKARIIDQHGRAAIFYRPGRGLAQRTHSLEFCLMRVFVDENNAVRKNLENVITLRNESVHLVISSLPSDVMELLQSCVLNYHQCLQQWFAISLSDRVPTGLMNIAYDLAPLQAEIAVLRGKLGAREISFLTRFQAQIRNEADRLGHPREFVARVEHRVIVRNHPNQADVRLIGGVGGTPTHVVDRPRDPFVTHPLRTMQLVKEVQDQTALDPPFTQHGFHCICKVWNVRNQEEWFYQSAMPGSSPQYSQRLLDDVLVAVREDRAFTEKCKAQVARQRTAATQPAFMSRD
jgi:hypothetical protein